MALSARDQQVIADMEGQFRPGDPVTRLQRRAISWMLSEMVAVVVGCTGCLLGLVLWWPVAAGASAVVTLAVAALAAQLVRSRPWLGNLVFKRLRRGRVQMVRAVRAARGWLDI